MGAGIGGNSLPGGTLALPLRAPRLDFCNGLSFACGPRIHVFSAATFTTRAGTREHSAAGKITCCVARTFSRRADDRSGSRQGWSHANFRAARHRTWCILLAGTDFPFVFNSTNMDFPHLDAARARIDTIMNQIDLDSRQDQRARCGFIVNNSCCRRPAMTRLPSGSRQSPPFPKW